jgi:predicted transposase YbfD/YdcC
MPAMTCALVERLQTIGDPRRQSEDLKHPRVDISILGFCGGLGGCDDLVEIAEGAKVNEEVFGSFLELLQGIPAQDTFTRVFAMLKPTTLQEVLLPWLLERRGLPGDWIHLDGKTLRHAGRTTPKLKALPTVSAWAGQPGLTVGQVAVDATSNEITAMPKLLELLDLHDKIVTTEALGCQKDIAETIVAGGGDYLLAVKDNQPTLHAEIQAAFAAAATPPARSSRLYTTEDHGHGREEQRTVQVLPAHGVLSAAQCAAWLGVLTIVMVRRVVWCEATGVESLEVSSFLSSLPPHARRIGSAIRGHWRIENGLPWVLDVVFREDARRVYARTTAENVAFLNRLALSLLRGDTGKSSLKVKRKRAGWSILYLMHLLGFHST